jgi:hypothetical protein
VVIHLPFSILGSIGIFLENPQPFGVASFQNIVKAVFVFDLGLDLLPMDPSHNKCSLIFVSQTIFGFIPPSMIFYLQDYRYIVSPQTKTIPEAGCTDTLHFLDTYGTGICNIKLPNIQYVFIGQVRPGAR